MITCSFILLLIPFKMQNFSDEKIVDSINSGNISFLRFTQSDLAILQTDEVYVNLRFYKGDLQWTRILDLKVQLLQTHLNHVQNEGISVSQSSTTNTNESLEPPDQEQTDKSINGKHPINSLATWMKLVSKLSNALNNAINLDELRENFNAIVENIEEEHSVTKGPQKRENVFQPNELTIPSKERSHGNIQSVKTFQLKYSPPEIVNETVIGPKLFKCKYCNKSFTYSHNLKVHIRNHINDKPHKCSYCPKSFISSQKLKCHIRTHTGERPFKCNLCDKAFSLKTNYQDHLKTHSGEKPYHCIHCGKAFSTRSNCNAHMKRHSGEKPHQCNHCGKGFTFSTDLKHHLRQHTGEKPFKCTQCDKAFTVRKNLNVHMNSHSEVKPFKCTFCETSFPTNSNLTRHMKIHEEKNIVHTEKKQKPFKCSHCDQDFDTQILCSTHMKKHDVPYQCNICVKGFDSINKLFTHMKNHSKKQFKCGHCSKAFHEEKSLKRHIKTHNQGDNTYDNETSLDECKESSHNKDNNEENLHREIYNYEGDVASMESIVRLNV